jgi:hypothetical protein
MTLEGNIPIRAILIAVFGEWLRPRIPVKQVTAVT